MLVTSTFLKQALLSLKALAIDKSMLQTLWYENTDGEKYIPTEEDMKTLADPPEGFNYQFSHFPTTLHESCLEIITEAGVAACDHPEEDIRKTYGWVEGVEGRECPLCGGTQMKDTDQDWPEEWEAYGSREVMVGGMGWSEDLALALTSSGEFNLSESIILAATSCERCMNVLAYDYGLDWGYAEGSDEYHKCGTECEFCL